MKLSSQYPEFGPGKQALNEIMTEDSERTAFTQVIDKTVVARTDRPGIVFSSSSWTRDEDFGIMIDAFQG